MWIAKCDKVSLWNSRNSVLPRNIPQFLEKLERWLKWLNTPLPYCDLSQSMSWFDWQIDSMRLCTPSIPTLNLIIWKHLIGSMVASIAISSEDRNKILWVWISILALAAWVKQTEASSTACLKRFIYLHHKMQSFFALLICIFACLQLSGALIASLV